MAGVVNSQPASNLENVYQLVNNSIESIIPQIDSDNIYFEFNSPSDYSILKNRAVIQLSNSELEIFENKAESDLKLTYTIDNVKVNYNNTFRDGLFGVYLVERQIDLTGSYILSNKKIKDTKTFDYSIKDSLMYDEVKNLESSSLPFTQGKLPPEPFWKGILEPVIAVGTAAVTVFLFFSVRSK